ncbi:lecithin retinol acyltransferase family protein [Prochlorothrix hollandica]|uniref:lecithin retinol acyltransferase family protein n=1 Tax=Prochlorothrix hollandica TaxID=1223 RepID=UPI00333FD0BC
MAKGDHLYVYRNWGTLTHHGLDCGDGTVIHYRDGDAIVRSTLASFSAGQQLYSKPYAQADAPDVAIKRAFSRLGERDYHIVFNNCEHFVVWCKTGQHQSQQVNRALQTSLVGGILGGMALGSVFAIPAVAAAGAYGLHKRFEQANEAKDPQQAAASLRSALGELERLEHQLQPQLDHALREAYRWDCTARLALRRQREDLAKAALAKKQPFKKEALALHGQLQEVQALAHRLRQALPSLDRGEWV